MRESASFELSKNTNKHSVFH